MRPYLLERHHDDREDKLATLTELDLDLLEARARWGVTGAWIALAAVLVLLALLVRSEWNAHRIEVASRTANAALAENVRQLTDQLAERTATSRIASTAVSATEESTDRLRGQIAALGTRLGTLTRDQEALATRVDQQAAHVANLGQWRSATDDARADRDARIAALETSTKSNAAAVDARLTMLDRKVDSIDQTVAAQGELVRSTRSRQSAMAAAVPFFLAPYIHILDHSGR